MLKLFKVLFFVTACISLPATAGVINTYYENPGDNRAVYDDATNLIWLDLSETAGLTQAQALSMFEGFAVATSAQAFGLIGDLMSVSPFPNFQNNFVDAESWVGLFGSSEANLDLGTKGANTACSSTFVCSYGVTADGDYYGFGYGLGPNGLPLLHRRSGAPDGVNFSPDAPNASLTQTAWLLVADLTTLRASQGSGSSSVPEPTTIALFALTLLLLTSRRIKSL